MKPDLESQRKQVRTLAECGLTTVQISKVVQLPERLLRAKFADELERGAAAGVLAMSRVLFDAALAGDTRCLIFWLKRYAGWRDRGPVVEVAPAKPRGEPLDVEIDTDGFFAGLQGLI